ncbi:putative L,D-transpeptidase ErfK/SrfK [bacterium HR40]|nr:putative L,D-transpeptidase ErfK/SrfK [bacterium HR40]
MNGTSLPRRSVLAGMAAMVTGLPGCSVLSPPRNEGPASVVPADAAFAVYRARHEDTLIELARLFRLGYVELQAANPGVDPWLPREGTAIRVPTRHLPPEAPRRGLVVNVGDMRAWYYDKDGKSVRSWPIGIGREGHDTPLGTTRIVKKQELPTWYPPPSVRRERPELPRAVPPGPDNPLGSHALYLGWPAYLVHGTNIPWSVGRRQSNGCIRLYPEDIVELYALVDVGTPVTVVDQPVKVAWLSGRLWVEAHPTRDQADELEQRGSFTPVDDRAALARVLRMAGKHRERVDLAAVERILAERRGWAEAVTPPVAT